MILSTRTKVAVARSLRAVALTMARFSGAMEPDGFVRVRREGLNWVLDLSEGIDLSIYLMGGFERSVHAAYRRLLRPGGVCIDIGANIGSHTLPLAACVGDSGRVVAIEPTVVAFSRLKRNIAANESLRDIVTTVQSMMTASDDEPVAPSIYAGWPLTGTARSDRHECHLGVMQSTEGSVAMTLETLVRQLALDRVDLIKVDVDGYEMEVLEGAQPVLREMLPDLVIELAPYTWEERGVARDAPIRLLRGLGYRFSDLAGKPFSSDGTTVPDIPTGHSLNIIARRDAEVL